MPTLVKAALTAGQLTAGLAQIQTIRAEQFATGGDFVTSGPQMIMVGDNPGGKERVQVTPLSSPNIDGPDGGAGIVVNVSGNVLTQDFVDNDLAEAIKTSIRRNGAEQFGLN